MPGQLTIGGNIIATHTGIEGAGETNLTNVNLTSSVGNLPANRNLIINGDFRVNQRGAASPTALSSAYNYDRWYYAGDLYQVIEDLNVVNGDYTISWAGSDLTAAWMISSNGTNNIPTTGWSSELSSGSSFTVSGKNSGDHLWIRFKGTLANLMDVQVEAGTVATPFERRLIGTELALCQRYYWKMYVGAFNFSYATAASQWLTEPLYMPVTMRATPTVTVSTNSVPGSTNSVTVIAYSPNLSIFYLQASGANIDIYALGLSFTASSEL